MGFTKAEVYSPNIFIYSEFINVCLILQAALQKWT